MAPGRRLGRAVAVAGAGGERGAAEERGGRRGADGVELVERRGPDADARGDAADLYGAELRMLERAPGQERPAVVLVAVPQGELDEVVARDPVVVLDELGRPGHAEALEQVPELDDVADRAALVVSVVGEVAAQQLVRVVEELLVARDGRVA